MAEPNIIRSYITYDDFNQRTLLVELYSTGNGLVVDCNVRTSADNFSTHILIPTNGSSRIIHEACVLPTVSKYEFEVSDLGEIAESAKTIIRRGSFEGDEAQQLSAMITTAVDRCKEGALGRQIYAQGGWRGLFEEFKRNRAPRENGR